VLWTRF